MVTLSLQRFHFIREVLKYILRRPFRFGRSMWGNMGKASSLLFYGLCLPLQNNGDHLKVNLGQFFKFCLGSQIQNGR